MPKLALKLLGGFELRDGASREVPIRSRKLRGLIGYLALQPDQRHEREMLASLLWGDRFEAQARQSLRQALLMLRKRLGDRGADAVRADEETVSLSGATVQIDVATFERLAKEGKLAEAAAAYTGELLDGLSVRSEPFEAWLVVERTRLHDLAYQVWERLGDDRLALGDAPAAIDAGKRLIALEPFRESGQRLLMRAYHRAGRRAEALRHYQRFADALGHELGAEPDADTRQLLQDIRQSSDAVARGPTTVTVDRSAVVPTLEPRPLLDRPSIAVLPFADMSSDPGQEYFADGITEDIITGLSKSRMFFVISRNSTFTYKAARVDAKQVARELGVQYIVEGSVRRAGNRVRITAQLIDAASDKHVWAERYDREMTDVLEVQDEITRNIVASIAPELLSAEIYRVRRTAARNFDAWEIFMRAYWHLSRFTEADIAEARRLCAEAIELDPNGAGHHGLLAVTHVMDALYGWGRSWAASMGQARETAQTAVGLDDHDSLALRSLGLVNLYERRHDDAAHDFQRAIDLDPHEAENFALLGSALALAGDYDAGRERIAYAIRLSPRDIYLATWYNNLGMAAIAAGQDEDAVEWANLVARHNPRFPGGHRTLAAAYGHLGRQADARAALDKLLELLPGLTIAQLKERLPFKHLDDLERYLDGLRKAGLADE